MIHPAFRRFSAPRVSGGRGLAWTGVAGVSLAVTALGALAGSTLSTVLSEAAGWEWTRPVLAPLTALVAAATVYGRYRYLRLDPFQTRIARMLVFTGGAMMLAAVTSAHPTMAALALWSMTVVTVVVTALAAGAGTSEEMEEPTLPWASNA